MFFNYISKNIKVDMTLSILCFKHIIQSFTHINSPRVCDVKHVKQTDAHSLAVLALYHLNLLISLSLQADQGR